MSISTLSSVVIHLDSRFATRFIETDKTTNYIYDLTETIEVPDHELCEVSLYTATIPYSFYNVRSGINNEVRLYYYDDDSSKHETATIFLSEGNYSATALKAEFQSQVSALPNGTHAEDLPNYDHPDGQHLIRSFIFNTTYTRETLKYTFTLTTTLPNAERVAINFHTARNLFGFKDDMMYDLTAVDTARVIISENCIDINDSIHGLYVRQNLTTKSTLDNENGTFTNILARIPINTNAGGIIFHTPANTTHRAITSLRSIQSIGIKLTDDQNRAIDLNGLHWQISLLISFIPIPARAPQLTKVSRHINAMAEYNNKQQREQKLKKTNKRGKE